ncbi:MAG TPA: glycosyltransferase family 4 protein [Coleofasciculaceae cyanobacterium]|jgi:glycosyltransferase involved in cell wall biosynthesis
MKIVVTIEHRFESTPDGTVWTQTQFPYSFWTRYLEVFDEVNVVARVRPTDSIPPNWKQVNGEQVSVWAIPYYVGPWQYLKRSLQVKRAARNALGEQDAVILRPSSTIADCIEPLLQRTSHPYGVEVVADPYDTFAPGSVKHPLRPFFRWLTPRKLRHQCANAAAAAYVTQFALQRRYPPSPKAFTTYFSDVQLPEQAFASAPRLPKTDSKFTLIAVGTLAQLYKAPNILIEAVAVCVKKELDLELVWLGDGKHRPELEEQVKKLGLGDRIHFLGQLSAGDAVRAQLDRADLFVLPSYQEGLPRATIEAMARGLPCIGSTVGGFPELLALEDMVPPGNVNALAKKIREVVTDPQRMARMSVRNLEKTKSYQEKMLRERRLKFYRHLRETTEAWLKTSTE